MSKNLSVKIIESSVIGKLVQNERFKEWWKSEAFTIPFVSEDLPITFMDLVPDADDKFISEADQALTNFIKLDSSYKLQIAEHVIANFNEYCSYIGEDDIPEKMKSVNALNIWNFVYPTEIFISRRPRRDENIYIILACECEWEREHGLQLIFRQGKKLTRVSDQDGHLTRADAYDIPDSEDQLLSSF